MSDGGGILRALGQGRYRIEHPLAVNAKDGSVLVYVPEGEFEMGDGKDRDCPKHRVYLSAYWIGVYCVTNAQYLRFVEATGRQPPDQTTWDRAPAIWTGRSFPDEKAAHPVVCVSSDDAMAYAAWAGCELATEAQWEKAARGPRGLIYPWGNDWDEGKFRHYKNKGHEMTCEVQGYPQGVSGYGTYNQAGNVWEWCADWYDDFSVYYVLDILPERDPRRAARPVDAPRYRLIRGGWWGGGGPGEVRSANRGTTIAILNQCFAGFRLVRALSGPLPS